MALMARVAGVLPLAAVAITAFALSGAAVFAVTKTGCADPGNYVFDGGQVRLTGGCLAPDELPPGVSPPAGHTDRFQQSRP